MWQIHSAGSGAIDKPGPTIVRSENLFRTPIMADKGPGRTRGSRTGGRGTIERVICPTRSPNLKTSGLKAFHPRLGLNEIRRDEVAKPLQLGPGSV